MADLPTDSGRRCYSSIMSEARRAARASWEISISRGAPESADGEQEDELYWLRVPMDERAKLTWDLSRELYAIAARNQGVFDEEKGAFDRLEVTDLERRLPRAALVITRR